MKKNILMLALLLSAGWQQAFGQWKGFMGGLGYTFGSANVKAAGYNPTTGATHEQKRQYNVAHFSMMAAGGHAFWDMNFGIPVNKKDKIGNVLNTKLAFGGYLGKRLGIMVGGQYNYITIPDLELPSSYSSSFVEAKVWNQRGIGAHLLLNPSGNEDGKFLLRISLMNDWLRREKKKYKGDGGTFEGALYWTDPERSIGLQLVATFSNLTWDSYQDSSNKTVPENKINVFNCAATLILPLSACGSASSSRTTIITITPK